MPTADLLIRWMVTLRRVAVLVTLSAVPVIGAALELGSMQFSRLYAPAPHVVLQSSPRFFFESGGVAFTQTARSADGYAIKSATYVSTAPDGQRLALVFSNGATDKSATPTLYDWVLIPIIHFVAGKGDSVVTLFGDLEDQAAARRLRQNNDKIINYHEAFDNTLMGLRLLQADLLVINPNSVRLFSEGGIQIIGAGEQPLSDADIARNALALQAIDALIEKHAFQSYVVGDIDLPIRYRLTSAGLEFLQQPRWYFWKTSDAAQEASEAAELKEGIRRLRKVPVEKAALWVAVWTVAHQGDERERVHQILNALKRTQRNGNSAREHALLEAALKEEARLDETVLDNISQLCRTRDDGAALLASLQGEGASAVLHRMSHTLNQLDEPETKAILSFWSRVNESKTVTESIETQPVQPIPELDSISQEIARRGGINPLVYRAVSDGMNFSALLREYKQKDPAGFGQLSASVRNVALTVKSPPGYKVSTPTVYPEGTSARTARN